jgi:Holliday junction resolvase RusA-like endonuclease
MIVTIPFKTPTINHLYWHRGNMKIMKKEARELQKTIKELVPELQMKDRLLKIEIHIYEDWYCQNGTVARKDVSNREKFLIDAVFKALNIDDKYIFIHTLIKEQSETEEKAIIEITWL